MTSLFQSKKFQVLFLIISCIIVYANSFRNNFVWDDTHLILNNPYVKDFRHIKNIVKTPILDERGRRSNMYRPIQMFLYLLIYKIFGLRPFGFHLANLLFHTGCVILGYLIFSSILPRSKIPFYASLLFAVHPLNTEAVTYISGSADLLGCFFAFLSILLFSRSNYFLSLTSFCAAILSKEAAVITPAIFLLYILCYRPLEKKKLCLKIALFLILIVIYGIFRLSYFGFNPTLGWQVPFRTRILTETNVILVYLRLLFLPLGLHMERRVFELNSIFEPEALFALGVILTIFIIAISLFKRQRIIFFGITWFFIFLLPSLNIISLNALLSEHWVYMSALGFFISVLAFMDSVLFKRKFLLEGILILTLVFYSVLTVQRNKDWFDEITIFKKTLVYAPYSGRVHFSLGSAYLKANLEKEAEAEYKLAEPLIPRHGLVYASLGSIYYKQGKKEETKELFEKAIRVEPDLFEAHRNLGNFYFLEGELEDAIKSYKIAVALKPEDLEAHNKLGIAYLKTGRHKESEVEFNIMLRIAPNSAAAYYNLACLYSIADSKDKALGYLQKAIKYGFLDFKAINADKDLDNIRNEAGFKRLLKQYVKD